MPQAIAQPTIFEWVGGEPCLDFNNTVSWNREGLTEERLRTPDDLLAWGVSASLSAEPRREGGRRILDDAIRLRRTLHRILSPLYRLHAPAPEDLAEFNRFLARALARVRISRGKGIFAWDFSDSGAQLDPI